MVTLSKQFSPYDAVGSMSGKNSYIRMYRHIQLQQKVEHNANNLYIFIYWFKQRMPIDKNLAIQQYGQYLLCRKLYLLIH